MIINVWLALRDDAQALIKTRLSWDEETQGEYTGPVTNRQFKLFKLMHDLGSTQKLFRVDTVGGRDWTLWSVYFNFKTSVLQKIKDELDDLALNFPNHIKIIGAWHWDSRQAGTQWELDIDGNRTGNVTGTPIYPLHSRILKLMPDIVTYDIDGNVISTVPATVPADINLGLGQIPRRF